MRVMPIDDFLADHEDSRTPAVVPTTSPIDGRSYDWNRIVSEGKAARAAADGGSWHIGGLAMLVEKRYRSGALQRFADEIGESYGTVRRFRWVAGAFDPSARLRYAGLSFSHFQAVASLPDRLMWLQRAYRGGWSVDRLVTQSRARSKTKTASDSLLRKPIESATKRLARLTDEIDTTSLPAESRKVLEAAVSELAAQVETLRARLSTPTPARRKGAPKRKLARVR